MGMEGCGGEIVEVQGGHIVRSTGRKDRHSKIYTAKGPRDRRVRLSAHTAIQFYDVQDRLGYDRPSKAVDWLIKKAKSSIDKLVELPPWHPITTSNHAAEADDPFRSSNPNPNGPNPNDMVIAAAEQQSESSTSYNFNFELQRQRQSDNDSNFNIPPSLDSDNIADTMKSFFPTNTSSNAAAASSVDDFRSYPTDPHLISATTQDLGLSLHSFQDQGLNIHHNHTHTQQSSQALFAAAVGTGFDSSSYQRMVAWSNENRGLDGGFVFNSHSHSYSQPQPHNHGGDGNHGSTLQSSFTPSVSTRAWQQQHSSIFGTRFGTSDGTSPVFCIQGEEAENGTISDRPSSTSSLNSTRQL
ncbi:hypothetical protein FF1_025379 [Malus domestica]|uniref:transcription factor TCP4-like n=1 Tax=Malus sylvestris TaxID=3752 RepID=UPI0010AA2E99|nr:transcription factor TCP4-like [Malus domestica]XP_050134384.1 transcription factor TCP4-like [Malus sylvestris]